MSGWKIAPFEDFSGSPFGRIFLNGIFSAKTIALVKGFFELTLSGGLLLMVFELKMVVFPAIAMF